MVQPETVTDPFKKLVECHDQILKHLQVFEDALNDLERNGIHAFKKERENITETFGFFHTAVTVHTRDEEDGLFPLLEPKLQRRPILNPHFERTPIQAIQEQHRKAEAETQRLEILHSKLGTENDEEGALFSSESLSREEESSSHSTVSISAGRTKPSSLWQNASSRGVKKLRWRS